MDPQLQFFVVSLVATVAGIVVGYWIGRIAQVVSDAPSKFWYHAYEDVSKENTKLRLQLLRELKRQYDDGYRAHR